MIVRYIRSVLFILILALITETVNSQVPMSFNYQAVLRNDAGEPMVSQDVTIEVALLQGGVDGTEVFTESHPVQTNDFGLVNLKIGSVNSLEDIDWEAGDLYIQISVDGILMGTSPLLSVPFALHAHSSADSFSGDYNDLSNIPDISAFVNIASPQDGDLVFFDGDDWMVISIGNEGQVLTVVEGTPQWADLPGEDENGDEPGTVSDVDGNVYPTVMIGNQEWMAVNLRTTRYADGSDIPTNLDNATWASTTQGARTVYPHASVDGIGSDEEMIAAYGRLYNWYTTVDTRGLCPTGWRVPTGYDWIDLTSFLTGQNPDDLGNRLKSCRQVNSPLGEDCAVADHPRWNSSNNHHGTDEYGFNALPASARTSDGSFIPIIGHMTTYWSTSEFTGIYVYTWGLYASNGDLYPYNMFSKNYGFSVRCIKE
ncbi:MAG: hypothetical protein EA361_17320 [Bacteroidetes bacterium]|nr:MAG: hypothetical protein EA361_17320 [Bacteroidota bacterium]